MSSFSSFSQDSSILQWWNAPGQCRMCIGFTDLNKAYKNQPGNPYPTLPSFPPTTISRAYAFSKTYEKTPMNWKDLPSLLEPPTSLSTYGLFFPNKEGVPRCTLHQFRNMKDQFLFKCMSQGSSSTIGHDPLSLTNETLSSQPLLLLFTSVLVGGQSDSCLTYLIWEVVGLSFHIQRWGWFFWLAGAL